VGVVLVEDHSERVTIKSSGQEQIDPSSPNLYDTSLGSIHIVNSAGKYLEMSFSPVAFAASLTIGSILELILMQRYALPLFGFCVSQWSLNLSDSSSSNRALNWLANWWGRWLLRSILEKNSHAQCTSSFMVVLRRLEVRNMSSTVLRRVVP